MSKQKIIAFYSPYPQAGKSTAADYIKYNGPYWGVSFADPIYEIVREVLWRSLPENKISLYADTNDKNFPIPELNGASVRDFFNNLWAGG